VAGWARQVGLASRGRDYDDLPRRTWGLSAGWNISPPVFDGFTPVCQGFRATGSVMLPDSAYRVAHFP
jgi:hypothetical protein